MEVFKINKNKIELIGKISSVSYIRTDINGKKFMFFDVVQKDRINEKSYSSSFYKIKLNEDLMEKYQDIIKISNNVYITGYLNSYLKGKQNIYYVYPKEIRLLDKNFNLDYEKIIIDGKEVELWNGEKCESVPCSEEERQEMEELLKEFN